LAELFEDSVMNERSIFAEALDITDPDARAAYLDQVCGHQPGLRLHFEELLAAQERLGNFLARPHVLSGETQAHGPVGEGPGAVIGPYKLLQQIGEGGMGVVYMAEQEQPIRRRVALKIIKPGMDSAQVIARFEAERQALALMDHQNIAKVLDAGTTDSGRPYFVMELVHGVPNTQYCDDHQLTPRQRLELFLPVCQAVQHAHQKGIIHRDLKPSNVLVCLYDGVPVPKVIDFGVAKATGQSLTERTMFTQFGSLVGTLEYMSPEQAEMSQLGIDTRSDVYSMGVMLYELLTGTTPLERKRVKEAGFDEIRRLIREEDPPKPSTRLSNSGVALAAISAQRQTEPAKLTRLVRGELDWIVMKALEKDRNRRYESANSLGRDVERYLHDGPVEACPPTASYKLRKFARKHKAGLATALGFAVLLVLGVAGSTWQAVRATQAEGVAQANENKANAHAAQAEQKEKEAKNERDEAQRQRDEVRALNEKLRNTLYASDMNLAQHAWEAGAIERVRELLERHRPKARESDLRNFEWYYLYRLGHSDLLTLDGADGDVVFSPDGKRLASSGKVWDAQTGQELLALPGTNPSGHGLAYSFDGKRLATSSKGNTVKVWNAQTGHEILSLIGHSEVIYCVAYSPDGKRLATASEDKTVKLWDAHIGKELLSFKGLNGPVAFSPDSKRLATTSGDYNGVRVLDTQTGQELLTLLGPTGHGLAYSPDGKRLASGSGYGIVTVWDAMTGHELLAIKESNHVNAIAYSPDGKRLASTSLREVKVWDALTGRELLSLKGSSHSVAFSPDGKRLATVSKGGIKILDTTTNPESRTLKGHTSWVTSVVFSPDCKRLTTASGETVKVWDARTSQELLSLKGHTSGVNKVAFSGDGKRLASASDDKTVKVWDAQTGKELLTFKGHTSHVVSVAFSPDSTRLASSSSLTGLCGPAGDPGEPGEVKIWDSHSGQELLTLKGHRRFVNSVAFSPDGKRLATLSRDNTVKVWDAQTGQVIRTFKANCLLCGSVAFSPDGKRLASTSAGEIKVWNVRGSQEKPLSLRGHTSDTLDVVFSPDGNRLASVSHDEALKVWDAQTGQELLTLPGGPLSVTFSPDGHVLASGVKIYDATPLPEKP
jgi:WD40 repeat protein/serine/threonine protein kinase